MDNKIRILKLQEADIYNLWQIAYVEDKPEWKNWDGPYFEDYKQYLTYDAFQKSNVYTFYQSDRVRGIFIDNQVVGVVSFYWENEKTRWLEIGIVIYDKNYWNGGYGTCAIRMWLDIVFEKFKEIEHIGLTTWSGNHRMLKAAEKVGMIKEAQIRKVRYWQGYYYDSVKYGVLRDEWANIKKAFVCK